MEAKVRDFARQMSHGVELRGLRCGDGQDLCSSRGDDNVRNASQGSVLLSTVRSLFEFNAGGVCYGYYDVGWAYSHLFLPWVDKLAFVRGIEQGLEPLDPRTLFAALTVVALVMDWIHWRPDQVDFDPKNGYLKLRNFFGAKSTSPQLQDLLGNDSAPPPRSDFGAYVPTEEAKAVAEAKQVKETISREKRVSKYNEECAKAFPAVLWTSQDMIDYRAFLSQIGSNDFVEGCPFVHYMPFLDPGSTPDLLVHCGLFGLFDFIKRQVSHLVSETATPLACLLTSGTTVGQEAELDDGNTIVVRREPEVLVLHDRTVDSTRLHPQSIYHRSTLSRFFGLVESKQREWLYRRHVFGVATEPLDEEEFYSERVQMESLDRAALQEAERRQGGEPHPHPLLEQKMPALTQNVPMEEIEGDAQDPGDRLISLMAELSSLSLDALELLQDFCTHSNSYHRENTRTGINTVNPHRMNALRVFRTLMEISSTPAMMTSFLAEVRKFITLRTTSIAQASLRQGKKVQPYYEWMGEFGRREEREKEYWLG